MGEHNTDNNIIFSKEATQAAIDSMNAIEYPNSFRDYLRAHSDLPDCNKGTTCSMYKEIHVKCIFSVTAMMRLTREITTFMEKALEAFEQADGS